MLLSASIWHTVGDLLQSIGVVFAGGLIWWNPSLQIADPLATLVFAAFVLASTVGIMRRSLHVLMEGSPEARVPSFSASLSARAPPRPLPVSLLALFALALEGYPPLLISLLTSFPPSCPGRVCERRPGGAGGPARDRRGPRPAL